jgi:hypothetical protein
LSLQSGSNRLVKDEYSAGVTSTAPVLPTTGGMDVDGEAGTIQHHPPSQRAQYNLHTQPSGMHLVYIASRSMGLIDLLTIFRTEKSFHFEITVMICFIFIINYCYLAQTILFVVTV